MIEFMFGFLCGIVVGVWCMMPAVERLLKQMEERNERSHRP